MAWLVIVFALVYAVIAAGNASKKKPPNNHPPQQPYPWLPQDHPWQAGHPVHPEAQPEPFFRQPAAPIQPPEAPSHPHNPFFDFDDPSPAPAPTPTPTPTPDELRRRLDTAKVWLDQQPRVAPRSDSPPVAHGAPPAPRRTPPPIPAANPPQERRAGLRLDFGTESITQAVILSEILNRKKGSCLYRRRV